MVSCIVSETAGEAKEKWEERNVVEEIFSVGLLNDFILRGAAYLAYFKPRLHPEIPAFVRSFCLHPPPPPGGS